MSGLIPGKSAKALQEFHMLYGTAWKKEKTTALVLQAFQAGFQGVDTACQPKHYQENLVGNALHNVFTSGTMKREDVWIQTKYTSLDGQDPARIPYDRNKSPPDQARESIDVSRNNLKLEVIDSWVLHSPMRGDLQATLDVWTAMEESVDSGKVQALGISNCYDINFFKKFFDSVRHKPKILQNRFYGDTHWDSDLRAFCRQNQIVYQSFWTLSANPELIRHRYIKGLATKYKVTPQQLMYRFLVDCQHQPLSGCCSENHVKEAVAVEHMNRLEDGELVNIKNLIGDEHPI